MITFWIAAVLATAVALGLIAALAARPVAVAIDPSRAVYRRQLSEIDDMATRGLLGDDERKSAYAEAARRLLGEADPAAEKPAPPGAGAFVAGIALMTGVFAIAIYLLVGHPALPDQPFAQRLGQWKNTAPQNLDYPQIVALLEDRKDQDARGKKPADPGLLAFLGQMQMRQGNYMAAARNLERSAGLAPNVEQTWDDLGQSRAEIAQDVTPDARAAFEKALALNPKALAPRFYLAQDDIKKGRVPQVPDMSPDQAKDVNDQIAALEHGESAVPDANANPAILSMVQGLADRLKSNPNDPEGWARLVRAYAVLHDQKALDAALAEVHRYFKDRPKDIQAIEAGVNTPAPAPK